MLRRIFGPKSEEVAGGCRRLHNEELHNLYTSPNIIRVIKSTGMTLAGHVARMGEIRNVCKKGGRKRSLGIRRQRWEDNIRMDRRKIGCEFVDLIRLAQVRDQ
jgi:hypothetical protein